MATKAKIAKEKQRNKTVNRFRVRRDELRVLTRDINNPESTYDEVIAAGQKLQKQPRNASPSRLQHRCRQCGRPRGVLKKFGLCRIHLREATMRGDVTGLRKASW